MEYLVGTILALVVGVFATVVGLDRDRAFYPTVMIVIAFLYSLFALIAGSREALVAELLVGTAFVAAAVAGFRWSLWIVAAALLAHGIFDAIRGEAIVNPGVPVWWPPFCAAYDIVAAGYLAWLLKTRRVRIAP